MFRILYKNLTQSQGLTRNLQTQSLKSKSNSPNQHSPTVSYLINSCGLSPDSAISASKKLHIETTEKADSVLELFKTYGFTNAHITRLITKNPRFIASDPIKTLKPKFEFLESLGFSGVDLAGLICTDTFLLQRSLHNRIIPTITFLKTFLHTNKDLTSAIKQSSSRIFIHDVQARIVPNISALTAVGVPQFNVSKLLKISAKSVALDIGIFKQVIRAVQELEFDPESLYFVFAVRTLSETGMSYWEKKVEILKSFGWSKEDVLSAFKLQPMFMLTSEKKIKLLMDTYVNKLGIKQSDLVKCPNLFLISLEKRIVPRCSVLQFLLSKGLIAGDYNMPVVLSSNKKSFEQRFVTKYQGTIPEVVKAYKGEAGYPCLQTLRSMA